MTICYFGIYNSDYSRNRIIIKGLEQNGIKVIECNSRKQGILKYWNLIKKHQQIKNDYDLMIVGFPGYQSMILAKIICRKKIIFDAFTSMYDSAVGDRQIVGKHTWRAVYYWLLDWLSCVLADKILLDTNSHINYFIKTFKIKNKKFIRVLIGADDDIFNPQK